MSCSLVKRWNCLDTSGRVWIRLDLLFVGSLAAMLCQVQAIGVLDRQMKFWLGLAELANN
jgi:hypothetical protein